MKQQNKNDNQIKDSIAWHSCQSNAKKAGASKKVFLNIYNIILPVNSFVSLATESVGPVKEQCQACNNLDNNRCQEEDACQ